MELDEIIRRASEIDARVRQLLEEREKILRQDPEYSEYLDAFEEHGRGNYPLSIARFHALNAELLAISDGFSAPMSEEFEAHWQKHIQRIMELERLLLA